GYVWLQSFGRPEIPLRKSDHRGLARKGGEMFPLPANRLRSSFEVPLLHMNPGDAAITDAALHLRRRLSHTRLKLANRVAEAFQLKIEICPVLPGQIEIRTPCQRALVLSHRRFVPAGPLIRQREAVVRVRNAGSEPQSVLKRSNRFVVPAELHQDGPQGVVDL